MLARSGVTHVEKLTTTVLDPRALSGQGRKDTLLDNTKTSNVSSKNGFSKASSIPLRMETISDVGLYTGTVYEADHMVGSTKTFGNLRIIIRSSRCLLTGTNQTK